MKSEHYEQRRGVSPEYEVYTTSPWNYALKVDLKNPEKPALSIIKRTQQLSEQL